MDAGTIVAIIVAAAAVGGFLLQGQRDGRVLLVRQKRQRQAGELPGNYCYIQDIAR